VFRTGVFNRLHRIALTNTDRCDKCGQIDTLIYRVTDYGAGRDIWNWTQARLAMMLNKRPQHTHADWILRPKKVKGHFMGLFQHCGRSACILTPNKFSHSSPEAARIIQMRGTSTSEGGNYYQ